MIDRRQRGKEADWSEEEVDEVDPDEDRREHGRRNPNAEPLAPHGARELERELGGEGEDVDGPVAP